MRHKDANSAQQYASSGSLLRVARRLFPNTLTFRKYIEELNSHIPDPTQRISLEPDQDDHPGYARLMDRLYVAWPQVKEFPAGIANTSAPGSSVSVDQIVQNVIIGVLRRYPSRYEAQNHNILCNGFALGSQHGKGSIFRNLDLRSSSSQIQFLRSPAWKQLLRHIGAVLLIHLLKNSILLVAVLEEADPNAEQHPLLVSPLMSSVFLQICGPPPKECNKRDTVLHAKTAFNIVLKRDLLYQTPSHRENSLPLCLMSSRSVDAICSTFAPYNSGLPKSHHLQGLRSDTSAARQLVSVVFSSRATDKFSRNDRTYHIDSGTEPEQNCDNYRTRGQVKFNGDISRQRKAFGYHARGQRWLRQRKQFHKRLVGVVPIFQKVIKRTHSASFRRLLGRLCPLQMAFKQKTDDQPPSELLIRHTTKPEQVAKFLVACFRQIAPPELFGSERNRAVFEKAVHNFIRRRMKSESFNIHHFCSQGGFVVSDVKWLYRPGACGKVICNPTDLAFRRSRLEELFVWLFRGILLPLTCQNFYITEGDLHRNKVFFFRREVWSQLIDGAYDSLLRTDRKFAILSKDDLTECTLRRAKVLQLLDPVICPYPVLTYHDLRFVPKRVSLRGIQRVRGKMLSGFAGFREPKSVNIGSRDSRHRSHGTLTKAKTSMKGTLRHILRILGSEGCTKSSLGASVFSLDDIFVRLLALKQRWLRSKCPRLYTCSVDITASFDTVPLGTLFSDVVPSILTKERYVALRYGVAKPNIATGKITQRYFIYVCSEPGEEAAFSRVVRRKLSSNNAGAVFTDLVQATTLSRAQILTFLAEFLATNIVAIPKRSRRKSETGFAVQCRGLPQGNQLSPLLTSLFYAHVENHDLAEFSGSQVPSRSPTDIAREHRDVAHASTQEGDSCLLMRQVDDTIFFTSNKIKAIQFLERMVKGWKPTHGFCVNVEKTKSNFTSGLGGKEVEHMPWCGLIIDASSLQVRADYTRYGQDEGGCVRDSLFIEHEVEPGTNFAERAWTCFKPKLHPVLLDSRMNSRATVALNLYQAALLACLKLSSYTTEILPREKHLSHVVEVMISKFVELVTRCMHSRTAVSQKCRLLLSQVEVRYVTLHAFHSGIVKKLRPRREMQKRVRRCQRMLRKNLDELTKRVRQQRDSSIETIAKRICETACKPLWTMRL